MKYFLLVVVSILFTHQAYSQNLKTKKKKNQFTQEIYQIDKKSKAKNGFYYKISTISKDTLVIGNYLNDRKIGLWTYNKMNGEKYIEFNYETKTIASFYGSELKSDSTYILHGNKFVLDKVDHPQIYLGYENEALTYIVRNIKLPLEIVKNGVTGRSVASFVVDENGKIRDQKIEFSLNKEFDKKILDVISKLAGDWIPATKDDKAFSSKIILSLDVQSISHSSGRIPMNKEEDRPYLWHTVLSYSIVPSNV
ncbi:hypothetical protein EO244_07550 [Ancylomarina salipaludis]|uniref:TonB C-terminal domain-containing protein n=1 Tax=Ancylomarina salipaludis TaxID=2501299 RepID=A0A4Q1JMD4_9BACT|nr:energy transducer TonB [Ancylomarina salipaludis]RXQ95708.1 hypothetical protein EO244_07550 [Ancylomarina salipaludis]